MSEEFLSKEKRIKLLNENKCVIVGAGKLGDQLYNFFHDNGISISAVCDNDENKHGKVFGDLIIKSLENAVRDYSNAVFLIASKNNACELERQLEGYGINNHRIMDGWIMYISLQVFSSPVIQFSGRVPQEICIKAGQCYQTRAESTIDVTVKAVMETHELQSRNIDFWVYTGDKSDEAELIRKSVGLNTIFSYSTKKEYPNVIPVPDFIYSSWKESGIDSWEETKALCEASGRRHYTDGRMFWIGNVKTHKTREILIKLSSEYPDLICAEGMTWQGEENGQRLRATKFVPLNEQARYKYLIDIQGNGYSGRLKILFFLGRPVFIAKRSHKDFFFDKLRDMKNCVMVEENLSDLIEKIRILEKDDILYKNIVSNGRKLANEYLSKKKAIEYYGKMIMKYGCHG